MQRRKFCSRFLFRGKLDSSGYGGMTDAAAVGVSIYPSETTKGSRAIVRALLMATVNSR